MPVSMTGSLCTPLAASNAFSLLGLAYVAIPVIVLLASATFCSRRSRRPFGPIVFGAATAIVAMVLVGFISAKHPNGVLDRNLAAAANLAACIGALLGVAGFCGLRRAGLAIRKHRSDIADAGY